MSTSNSLLERFRPRFAITLRTLVAVGGGYALAAGMSLWCAYLSGAEGREARTLISFWFFIFYAAAIIWLYAINRHSHALAYGLLANGAVWGTWLLIGGNQ